MIPLCHAILLFFTLGALLVLLRRGNTATAIIATSVSSALRTARSPLVSTRAPRAYDVIVRQRQRSTTPRRRRAARGHRERWTRVRR
ncbi:hypothetical protein C8J57DRAFT_1472638 [Mycena rebaudengoi]|nr:hypothetical protein C8J57DRAFT_1472638 [Mycena rebaudengoi]